MACAAIPATSGSFWFLTPKAFDEQGQAADERQKVSMCQRAYKLLVEQVGFDPQDIPNSTALDSMGSAEVLCINYSVSLLVKLV